MDDREVVLVGELPEDLVEELAKPIPLYETDLDHLLGDRGSSGDQDGR